MNGVRPACDAVRNEVSADGPGGGVVVFKFGVERKLSALNGVAVCFLFSNRPLGVHLVIVELVPVRLAQLLQIDYRPGLSFMRVRSNFTRAGPF